MLITLASLNLCIIRVRLALVTTHCATVLRRKDISHQS